MTDKNYTHIIFILDRSGSMWSVKEDTVGGFNALTKVHQEGDGKCTMSLVQFDHEIETVYSFADVTDAEPRTLENYHPRGSTALMDAIGMTIVSEGEKLAAMEESTRPGLVILAVLTDGRENASKEYNKEQISGMIAEQQSKYNWEVTYLSADPNAFADAQSYGFSADTTAIFDKDNMAAGYEAVAQNSYRARGNSTKGLDTGMDYSPAQRGSMQSSK